MEPLELIVTGKQAVAADTVRLRLERADGGPLPDATPGAHVVLDVDGRVRRYSLLHAATAPRSYEIGVLRVDAGQGGSRFIHDRLSVGDRLQLLDVANDFPLDETAPHTLLIGGGIGITPLLGMAEHLQAGGRSFALHQVVSTAARAWPLPAPAVLHVGRGALDLPRLLAAQPPGSQAYVCGPAGLVEAVRAAAAALGWSADRVHTESFGAAVATGDAPLRVTLVQSGVTLDVPPGRPLLDALLDHGVWMAHDCRRGLCGSCVAEVVSGQPLHRDSLAPELRAGGLCTCVSWAEGPALALNL